MIEPVMQDLSFLAKEPDEEYHAKAKQYLSSHQLADFRKCPLLFQKKREGLIPEERRPAYLVGRAAHTLILEGRDTYRRTYAVGGPVNPKTGKRFGAATKAFAEWAREIGKPVITDEQALLVENMREAVHAHDKAAELLSEGVAEGVVRTDYCDTPCQVRIDFFSPQYGIVDLKTCDNLTWFEADARRYGYAHQLAFYRAVLAALLGDLVELPVYLVAVEKQEPFRSGVWMVSKDVLRQAQLENEAAVKRLKVCERDCSWPTGYEDVRVFDAA